MTEDEADGVEEDEAADLVDFASNLNYDTYIDDLEVRQALCVIRERIDKEKAMQAAAEAADEAEAAAAADTDWEGEFVNSWNDAAGSQAGDRREKAAAAETKQDDWDASTVMSETPSNALPKEARAAAEELLKCNPALAAKHSVKSLAAAAATAAVKPAEPPRPSLAEQMAALPPPRIVTIIENPRVLDKANCDPSNLPYLHRNPAV